MKLNFTRSYNVKEIFLSLILGTSLLLYLVYVRFFLTRWPKSLEDLIGPGYLVSFLLWVLFTLLFFYSLAKCLGLSEVSEPPGMPLKEMSPWKIRFLSGLQEFLLLTRAHYLLGFLTHSPQALYEFLCQYLCPSFSYALARKISIFFLQEPEILWRRAHILCQELPLFLLSLIFFGEVFFQSRILIFYEMLWLLLLPLCWRFFIFIIRHHFQSLLFGLRNFHGIHLVHHEGKGYGLSFSGPERPSAEAQRRIIPFYYFLANLEKKYVLWHDWKEKWKHKYALLRYFFHLLGWGYVFFKGLPLFLASFASF